MYDRPETRAAWDALWQATVEGYEPRRSETRSDLPPLPAMLDWDSPHDAPWLDPDLTLAQTCSLPYRTRLNGKVTLLGTFDFGLPGCAPGYYNSVLVMRANDPRELPKYWSELTLAYNAPDSQSGWAAPYFHAQILGSGFRAGAETGAHAASARAVMEGHADIAALDAQTFRLLERYEPDISALKEIARTAPTPGLPLITRRGWDAGEFWKSLSQAVDDLHQQAKAVLDLDGLVSIHADRYTELPVPPAPEDVFHREGENLP